MVELMQNNEGVSHNVAAEQRNSFVFGRVTARNVCLVSFGQAYFQFRRVYSVVLCKERKGFFCFPVQNEPDDQWFEVSLQRVCSRNR